MDAAAQHLRPELEYRLRLILQEAWKFCRRARRTTLTSDDVYQGWSLVCGEAPESRRASGSRPGDVLGLVVSRSMLLPGATGFGGCLARLSFAGLLNPELWCLQSKRRSTTLHGTLTISPSFSTLCAWAFATTMLRALCA